MAGNRQLDVSSPLTVGREQELDSMRVSFERLTDGQARVVLVGGEAGIGKTRLIDEAVAEAGDSIRVLRGNCLVLGQSIPYLPFAEMLRGLIRDMPAQELAALIGPARRELARFMPELAPPSGAAPSTSRPRMSGEVDRLRLFEALLRVAERIAADRPTVFIIEDLQWIDPASLELLAFLTHALDRHGQASLVASVRTEALDEGGPVLTFLADLERSATVERIELGPLSADATRRQISAILGERPSDQLVARIHGQADGNPLFAEELLVAAADEEAPSEDLSPKLRDLLAARLAHLSDDVLAVLRVAAAAGRTLDDRLLASATGLDAEHVESAVRAAVEAHILTRGQVGSHASYRFRHEIMRTVVASQLLPAEAARVHAAYATALSAEPAERQNASEIAIHWDGSGQAEQALPARTTAGQEAANAFAFEQASEHFERALALWNEVSDPASLTGTSRAWIAERAGSAAGKAGHFDRAIELMHLVIDDRDAADPAVFEQARSSLRWYLWESGQYEIAREEATKVVDDPAVTGRWRANALAHLGGLLLSEQRTKEAQGYATETLELAGSVEARDEEILARGVLGWCLVLDGDVDAGLATIRDTIEAARALGDRSAYGRYPAGVALAHAQLASALELVGRLEEAFEVADSGVAAASQEGVARTYGSIMEAFAGRALYQLGRWDEAAAWTDDAIARGAVGSGRLGLLTVRALLAIGRGDAQTAEDVLADAEGLVESTTPLEVRRWMVAATAEQALWQGQAMEALLKLAVLGDDGSATALGAPGGQPAALDASVPHLVALAARAAADLALEERASGSDAGLAKAASEQVQATLKRIGRRKSLATAWQAQISLARAELDRADPGGGGSSRRWKAAADATVGRPYPAAYARWRLAEALLSRRDGRDKAAPVIEDGLALAEPLKARPLIDELRNLARRAGLRTEGADGATSVAPSGTGRPFGLTTREVEVLSLVADGLSNQEIADQLFISPKTASVHVSNIYGKLGVESRVAAATTAQSLGLTGAPADDSDR